jgi:hypothetical protein
VPVPSESGVCCADTPLADPGTCCLRWMRETPNAVCWALTLCRSPVTARTSSSKRSSRWTTLLMDDFFSELDSVRGMVEEPKVADTRMSRARARARYGRMEDHRLYLLITSRGPRPRWRGGAVTATRRSGRLPGNNG